MNCTKCSLSEGRTLAVPGEGPIPSDIMFIGEAPGKNEDLQGTPFIGRAGKILDELLASIDLKREDVYITNMVKCRPPKNRDPLPDEIFACHNYLDEQIDIIKPKVIVCLGRFSFGKFFQDMTITQARSIPRDWNGIKIFPVYHPAAATYNPKLKPKMIEDFSKLPELIRSVSNV